MNISLLALSIIGHVSLDQSAIAAPDCQNFVGKWVNNLSQPSTLTITSVDRVTGKIEGSYSSPSGTGGELFPAIGWLNLANAGIKPDVVPVISFSVRWGKYGSITAWSGTCRKINGVPTINTLWTLSRSAGDFEWDHQLAGADVFKPAP